jgi:hypothetical protein
MTRNSLPVQSAILFAVFSSLRMYLLAVAGSDFYRWYAGCAASLWKIWTTDTTLTAG